MRQLGVNSTKTYANFHVTDSPSVMINVDEICTTSITISLNTYSHPACGDVSHTDCNIIISGSVKYSDAINDSKCTFGNLTSNMSYNITVTSVYKNVSEIFSNSSRTLFPDGTHAYLAEALIL